MGGRTWTHKEVAQFFADHDCALLTTTYTGCNQILTYRCACGRETAETTFNRFKYRDGGQCHLCHKEDKSKKSKSTMNDPAVLAKRKETFRRNYGTDSPLQNPEVKRHREATCLERYGVRSVCQVPAIRDRQAESHTGDKHFMRNPVSLAKYRQTMIDRYGVPSLALVSGRSSIEGQKFFTDLFNQIPTDIQAKCYFSPHTHEFNVWFKGCYYKYDFVHSGLKKAIEYNGSRFHPQPHQKDDEIGWCLFNPKRTVREARQYEETKLMGLRSRGFDVLIIWDYEVKHNRNLIINQCLQFLGITPGNLPK